MNSKVFKIPPELIDLVDKACALWIVTTCNAKVNVSAFIRQAIIEKANPVLGNALMLLAFSADEQTSHSS
jgi:hypothetical protein